MAKNVNVRIKFNRLPKVGALAPMFVDAGLARVSFEGKAIVQTSMQSTPRGENGHSLPGNPPAIQESNLVNSINERKAGKFKRHIRAGTDYAELLEYGSSKMGARPFMQPMAFELEKLAPQILGDYLSELESRI